MNDEYYYTCQSCGKSWWFELRDGRPERTTEDRTMRIHVNWVCPDCYHINKGIVGMISTYPINIDK